MQKLSLVTVTNREGEKTETHTRHIGSNGVVEASVSHPVSHLPKHDSRRTFAQLSYTRRGNDQFSHRSPGRVFVRYRTAVSCTKYIYTTYVVVSTGSGGDDVSTIIVRLCDDDDVIVAFD